MSCMRVTVAVTVVKLQLWSAAIVSGGSTASWSVTWLAMTVTVQLSLFAKSASGFSVKAVGPPLALAVCAPLVAQEIVYQLPATSTGSPKVTVTSALTATLVAPPAGDVLETAGAASGPPAQSWGAEA